MDVMPKAGLPTPIFQTLVKNLKNQEKPGQTQKNLVNPHSQI